VTKKLYDGSALDNSQNKITKEKTPAELLAKVEQALSQTTYSNFSHEIKWVFTHMSDKELTKAFKSIFTT